MTKREIEKRLEAAERTAAEAEEERPVNRGYPPRYNPPDTPEQRARDEETDEWLRGMYREIPDEGKREVDERMAEQLRLEEEGDEVGAFSMAGCAVGALLEWWLSEKESEGL